MGGRGRWSLRGNAASPAGLNSRPSVTQLIIALIASSSAGAEAGKQGSESADTTFYDGLAERTGDIAPNLLDPLTSL